MSKLTLSLIVVAGCSTIGSIASASCYIYMPNGAEHIAGWTVKTSDNVMIPYFVDDYISSTSAYSTVVSTGSCQQASGDTSNVIHSFYSQQSKYMTLIDEYFQENGYEEVYQKKNALDAIARQINERYGSSFDFGDGLTESEVSKKRSSWSSTRTKIKALTAAVSYYNNQLLDSIGIKNSQTTQIYLAPSNAMSSATDAEVAQVVGSKDLSWINNISTMGTNQSVTVKINDVPNDITHYAVAYVVNKSIAYADLPEIKRSETKKINEQFVIDGAKIGDVYHGVVLYINNAGIETELSDEFTVTIQ